MATLPKPQGNYKPVPQGNHVAVCYRVIDLGTQRGEYKGTEKFLRKVLISWEIPDELMDDGRPFTIGQRFTWSMHEKATLRHVLESWRGKAFTDDDFDGPNAFDIANVIGKGCMLNVVHATNGEKTYANIKSVAKLPKGMEAPPPTNPRNYVWLSKEEFAQKNFDDLSDSLKDVIMQSPEFKALSDPERIADESENPAPAELEESIPF